MPMINLFTPFLRKRRSFSYEQELRLLYWQSDLMECPTLESSQHTEAQDTETPPGVSIAINVSELIDAIYISPKTDAYILETASNLLSKFDLNQVNTIQSNLLDAPA